MTPSIAKLVEELDDLHEAKQGRQRFFTSWPTISGLIKRLTRKNHNLRQAMKKSLKWRTCEGGDRVLENPSDADIDIIAIKDKE